MEIRKATKKDIDNIAELYVSNWRETYRGLVSDEYLDGMTLEYAVNKWKYHVRSTGKLILAAYEEERFAGFAACSPDMEIADCLFLASLHISPEYRSRGIGSALIRECLQYAGTNGFTSMSITVINGNDRAKKLYMRLGAVHHSWFDDILSNGEAAPSEKLIWLL